MKISRTMLATIFFLEGCLEPFQPPAIQGNFGYLVVDGFLNTNGNIEVRLSRTNSLSDKETPPTEAGALVVLEQRGSATRSFTLSDTGNGKYSLVGLNLNKNNEFRLRIRTKAKDYVSDYVRMNIAPAIDSIFYEYETDGIQLYVSTHDETNTAKFFSWNFSETWEYFSVYQAYYQAINGQIVRLTPSQSVYQCWKTENSTEILTASTKNQSVSIARFPVTFIPKDSPKISDNYAYYSILVQQRTLDETSYNFYQQLKKTTENLGGLFDPLPSQVLGNLRTLVNSTEPVLGYFSAGSITEYRIFIDPKKFPDYLKVDHSGECLIQNVTMLESNLYLLSLVPLLSSTPICLDCRIKGGATTKPPFWP